MRLRVRSHVCVIHACLPQPEVPSLFLCIPRAGRAGWPGAGPASLPPRVPPGLSERRGKPPVACSVCLSHIWLRRPRSRPHGGHCVLTTALCGSLHPSGTSFSATYGSGKQEQLDKVQKGQSCWAHLLLEGGRGFLPGELRMPVGDSRGAQTAAGARAPRGPLQGQVLEASG